ncbi:peroxide stress protein YaaA, partial [Arthrobacter sp. JCM 19049]|uniref:YaaA family protein n=1 Tax=Arthrobacter sp. JCM 19049 TaxID=1460643 RepID=UPI000ABE117B
SPCTVTAAQAHDVYSGVLFEALGYSTLGAAAQRRADESIVVVSALWGAVGFADRIPPYRLSMGVKLEPMGKLASWWKKRLTPVLDARAGDQLIVDARSSTYAAAYKPSNGNSVAVNVFQLRNGTPKVVSHFAKHTRGEVARFLVEQETEPANAQELLDLANTRWDATLSEDKKGLALNIVLAEDHQFTSPAKAPPGCSPAELLQLVGIAGTHGIPPNGFRLRTRLMSRLLVGGLLAPHPVQRHSDRGQRGAKRGQERLGEQEDRAQRVGDQRVIAVRANVKRNRLEDDRGNDAKQDPEHHGPQSHDDELLVDCLHR